MTRQRWATITRKPLLLFLLFGLFLFRAPQRLALGTGLRHAGKALLCD